MNTGGSLQIDLEILLARFKRRSSYFCTRSMKAAGRESHAETLEQREQVQRNVAYDEGAGECFIEAAEDLERVLRRYPLTGAEPEA